MTVNLVVKIMGTGLVFIGLPAITQAETELANTKEKMVFSPLTVSGAKTSPENSALEKPGAFSSRGESKDLQSIDSVIRSMPGTSTQMDPGQGTVSVNIRGMTGFGRVNTMVDGVTQSFYGSAPNPYNHGQSPTTQFGALIDPNFIVGIDVARGNAIGADGVNALAGSANFRTIGVDDVIFSGNPFGIRSKFSLGNNGIGRSGMIAVAGKTDAFTDTGSIGVMLAVSGSSIDASYKNGDGVMSQEFGSDETFKQNPQSQLIKLNIKPNEFNDIELSGRAYNNKISRRHINSDDFYIKYNYTPFSELIDLSVLASVSRGNQKYDSDALNKFTNSSAKNSSDAIDINNVSRFSYADTDFSVKIGGKLMNTEYYKHIETTEPDNKTAGEILENNVFAPGGRQDISSLYTGLQINRGIYQANFDLNYTAAKLKGFKPACDDRIRCFPQGSANINLNEHGFNPSLLLSADIVNWFQPFVSYNQSMRAPNVQEVFYSNEGGASMNPFLKGEEAETYQLGFNSASQGLIFKDDSLRFKAVYYRSKIKNYISSQSYMLCGTGRVCTLDQMTSEDWSTTDGNFNIYIYTNSLAPVRTHGFELEANYDAGFLFSRLSFSKENTDQPTSIASGVFGAGDSSEMPDKFLTLDTGLRFLDEKLTVGTIVKYTGKTRRMSPALDYDEHDGRLMKEEMSNIPTVVDIYGNYQMTKNVMLKVSVQNLMNKSYSDSLNKLNAMPMQQREENPNNTARGRTYLFGGEIRF
ncbi:TonB-dependent receptor [Yersinia nurmii]|uniref:TonB-dependent receptor n=1 Tax=Yersinia nurmii TaxID=685706 RepID=A0AAW7JYA5_9GAMM|nr:TonB-dependent receptor [Yersinia nurmii]MDN0087471.1 TonB-dependent receptor [Yersinia nurmii]